MPLQQISVSPLEWGKDSSTRSSHHDWKLQETVFATSGSHPPERCGSQASSLSNGHDICRICHCEGDSEVPLIAPCYCSGSLRYVHQACLQQWIKSSDIRSCELCKFQFIMHSKIKPFSEWETLEMSGVERRKLLCSVTFHAVALTCVVWSLYVLIDRTAEEIQRGALEWPFWTKLIVVAIGFTGGLVFMYIQCKAYLQLCRRWRAFNRVIFVQNAPEKVPLPMCPQQAPLAQEESALASEICCSGMTYTNEGKPGEVDSLTATEINISLNDSGKNLHSDLTDNTPSVNTLVGTSVCDSKFKDGSLNNVNLGSLNNYQCSDTKSVNSCPDSGKLSVSSDSYNMMNRLDLCGRKFSFDEPTVECGEMSHLLQSDENHPVAENMSQSSAGFLLLPSTRSPTSKPISGHPLQQVALKSSPVSSSSSEESFASPSVRLLQPPLQKPWIVGSQTSSTLWLSNSNSGQPLSTIGSQSPLLSKPVMNNSSSAS